MAGFTGSTRKHSFLKKLTIHHLDKETGSNQVKKIHKEIERETKKKKTRRGPDLSPLLCGTMEPSAPGRSKVLCRPRWATRRPAGSRAARRALGPVQAHTPSEQPLGPRVARGCASRSTALPTAWEPRLREGRRAAQGDEPPWPSRPLAWPLVLLGPGACAARSCAAAGRASPQAAVSHHMQPAAGRREQVERRRKPPGRAQPQAAAGHHGQATARHRGPPQAGCACRLPPAMSKRRSSIGSRERKKWRREWRPTLRE